MNDFEALGFQGFGKYLRINGYGRSFQFSGFEKQETREEYIVAIDALQNPNPQFSAHNIMREINKAYAGFSIFPSVTTVTSGNWGCGVFNGDPELKFMIQWIAASLAGKELNYCLLNKLDRSKTDAVVRSVNQLGIAGASRLLFEYEQHYVMHRIGVFDYLLRYSQNIVRSH